MDVSENDLPNYDDTDSDSDFNLDQNLHMNEETIETTVEESMTTDYVTTEETSSTHIPPDMSLQEKLAEIMSSRIL